MVGVKILTSYFKLLTKDEMKVEYLLATQLFSRKNSRILRTVSIESAIS
jgi:hypothetical protein